MRDGYNDTRIGAADDKGEKTVLGLNYDEAAQRARGILAEEEARRTSGVSPGGIPIVTASKLFGHADIRITEKHCAHLRPNHLQTAVDENLPDIGPRIRPQK